MPQLIPLLSFLPAAGLDVTAPIIVGVQAISITTTSFVASWITNEASDSLVNYGTTGSYGSSTTANSLLQTTHLELVSGLSAATLYHYRVRSIDSSGNEVIGSDQTVTTLTSGTDTTAPVISNVLATVTGSSSVRIDWDLDEPGTGQVEYGIDTNYGQVSVPETSFVYSSHSQDIGSLNPNTIYHFRVVSADASGNVATSGDFSFITQGATTQSSMYIPGVYGSALAMDSRNNYVIGGTNDRAASYRFVASFSSIPTQVAVNFRWGSGGYSAGTGGTIKVSIQRDDGAGYPDLIDLMSLSLTMGDFPGGLESRIYRVFPIGVPLTAGNIYHIVFINTDSSPTTNYTSVNLGYVDNAAAWPTQRQPAFTNDFSSLFRNSGTWFQPGDAGITDPDPNQDTPVFDLQYANGGHDGQGFFGILNPGHAKIAGTTHMCRQRFTVTGSDVPCTLMAFRVMRTLSTGDLTLTLETGAGSSLASGTVDSSTFDLVSEPPPGGSNFFGGAWGVVTFSQVVLSSGSIYQIRASCPVGTNYFAPALQERDNAGSGNPDWQSRVFNDGGGEYTTDSGTTWLPMYEFAPVDAEAYVALV